jgi:hypothetical protein
MNREEFKKFVLEEAKKYISSTEEGVKPTQIKEGVEVKSSPKKELDITPDEVKSLAEEISKINKSIDFRNPVIADVELVSESEDKSKSKNTYVKPSEKIKRYDDMIDYNNKKDLNHINESEKDKWNRMLNYRIPGDEDRG